MPEFREYPDRHARLKVDGNEQVVPGDRSGKRFVVDVQPADFKETIELELSFWPVGYSNTFRKRIVSPEKGKVTVVDMSKPDGGHPDRFEAIYVPTPDEVVAEALRLASVGKDDTVLDIGCGDGRVVIEAVKAGAKKGVGVDISQKLIDECKENAKKAGVAGRCEFRVEDALKMTDLSAYSVVFLCLGEDLQARLLPLLKTLPAGSRVVASLHQIEGWRPDQTSKVRVPSREQDYTVYLWDVK